MQFLLNLSISTCQYLVLSLFVMCWFCRTVLNISERPVIAEARASSFTLVESGDATGFVNAADPELWVGAIVAE